MRNMYSFLAVVVQTQSWTMKKFPYRISVFQGDPLSVVIFNMITSLFADSLLGSQLKSAYHFKCTGNLLQLLLFADAVLIANSVKSLQRLLCQTDAFLVWSKIEPKVVKCRTMAYRKRPTSGSFDPHVFIAGEQIPYGGDQGFQFLGLPIN